VVRTLEIRRGRLHEGVLRLRKRLLNPGTSACSVDTRSWKMQKEESAKVAGGEEGQQFWQGSSSLFIM
ncbi:hypothetical protein CEXT_543681, partial [Caerostris extrusa]